MKILVLDDDKRRLKIFRQNLIGTAITCVEEASDCIKELEENGPWNYIFLDHDLGGKIYVPSGPGTGYEVALWLKNHPDKKPNKIILQTCNDKGAKCMMKELPEAIFLSGVFLVDFSAKNLEYIESIYYHHIKMI